MQSANKKIKSSFGGDSSAAQKKPVQSAASSDAKKKADAKRAEDARHTSTKTSVTAGKKSGTPGVFDSLKGFFSKLLKIEKLPKTVQDSIPVAGFLDNGVIETRVGTFTKTYRLTDANFAIGSQEEQEIMFRKFEELLNSFDTNTKWEFTTFNHEINKATTLANIQFKPASDGLNQYRQEMNEFLLTSLKNGNNFISQDKYLTVSVEDFNVDHVMITFKKIDREIDKKVKKISGKPAKALTTFERVKLLYSIYNQDYDYRLATGLYEDGREEFSLKAIAKQGLSVKDLIAPVSIDYSPRDHFLIGDTYCESFYLDHVPTTLTTDFIEDITSLPCPMLTSITTEGIAGETAKKMVRSQLASLEARGAKLTKSNNEQGIGAPLPPELEESIKNARDLMSDLLSRNQKLFLSTITITIFAKNREQLDEMARLVRSVGNEHAVPLKTMKNQQEFCFNTSLPLCRNDIFAERLYTTEAQAVFIPYNSEELMQQNAIFYGLNSVTKSLVLYDRMSGKNYNGLIFGAPGSGKSFTAKCEMVSVLLSHPNAQIIIIDPQGEYGQFVSNLGGQEIFLAPGSNVYLNPLDLDISADKDNEIDPITMKSDAVISMFSIILKKMRQLSPIDTAILDQSVRKIYQPYLAILEEEGVTKDLEKCPTLTDLYHELTNLRYDRPEAGELADYLSQYAVGSFSTFAHRTNVAVDKKITSYNTMRLGPGMRELGLHICITDVWNRMIENSKHDIQTWFYIDEFHILLESPDVTLFLKQIWKMARKWLGVPTGMMQNTEDLMRDADSRAIMNNTSFVIIMNEPYMDRMNLAQLLMLSDSQLEYITDSEKGHGLLYNGKTTIPFEMKFPTNTKLYSIMTTAHDAKIPVKNAKKKKSVA